MDCSSEQQKTKAISSALAEHVAHDSADRDRVYNVIRGLYQKRGSVVHKGHRSGVSDFVQSYSLACAAFLNVLGRKELPKRRPKTSQSL